MKSIATQRSLLGLASVTALIAAYTVVSNAQRFIDPAAFPGPLTSLLRPDIIPPTQEIGRAFIDLIAGGHEHSPSEGYSQTGLNPRLSDHVAILLRQGVTLQGSLALTAARVFFGLAVGAPIGILIGLFMGLSRRADDYLHPIYVVFRSIPPLALITYVMLWLGHSEAHRLIPIVYAVAVTLVIPTYHAMRDVESRYVVAARSLGARGRLLLTKVLLPAASPALLAGLRYAVVIAWMTAVGAEMLMSENGMGNLIVGGGMWSSRLQTRGDPAVVIAGIIAIAGAGWAMDTAVRAVGVRLTRWARG